MSAERTGWQGDADDGQLPLAPVYLVCEESAAMADALGGLNEGVAGLIAEVFSNPLLADFVSLGLIAFSSAPRVAFRRWGAWDDSPSYHLRAGEPGRWGPVFRTLARVVTDDVRHWRADPGRVSNRGRIHRPVAFFLVTGPCPDPDWDQVFRATLTYDPTTGQGLKEHPAFVPVAVGAGLPDETLSRLAYPRPQAPRVRARDATAARHAVHQGLGEVYGNF